MLGGVKFQFRAQVKLTKHEAELVRRYGAAREVLLQRQIKIPFTDTAVALDIRIDGLIRGQVFTCKGIADVLEYERNVRDACETFRNYLKVMSTFGGKEVIHFAGLDGSGETAETDTPDDDPMPSPPVDDAGDAVSFLASGIDDDPPTTGVGAGESEDFCYHCGAGVHANSAVCPTCNKAL